jgi:hypothetical protein
MDLRSRPSYANIASTLALIVAIGGGTAWAATHHHHYVISSTGQIKPKVLKKLRGHNGTDGANGAAGAKGAKGASGPTGPTGVAGIVTATNTGVTLSATQAVVVQATAPVTGGLLVLGQVAGRETYPQVDGALGCSVVNVTAAPGTSLGSAGATFPKETLAISSVDVSVQAQVSATKGDEIAVECVAGSAGYSAPNVSIALIPMA